MHDLTIISNLNIADGIGKQGVGLLSCLKNDLDINTLLIQPANYKDIPKELMPIVAKPFDNKFGKVSFWTYILGINENLVPLHQSLKSQIKIAYSMFESDNIPDFWSKILNEYYDMVVVPDEWLVDVYQKSGVKIPIFVLPLGIWLEDFLAQPIKEKRNDVFTFGMTGSLIGRKNHLKLLKAFVDVYPNHIKNVKLKIHGRFGPLQQEYEKEVEKFLYSNSAELNVEYSFKPFSQKEYLEWFKSLDCYVFPSMGEGFSITPREALALGIPTIATNNTAQQTICKTGYIYSIPSTYQKPAKYEYFGNKIIGNAYDCDIDDIKKALQFIPKNYDEYLQKAKNGREWVKQYLWSELKQKYLSLIKPKNITFGTHNEITNDCLTISNKTLYNKYCKVFGK